MPNGADADAKAPLAADDELPDDDEELPD